MAGGEGMEILGIGIGVFVGAIIGWVLCALVVGSNTHNHHDTIANLRSVNRLINVEIIRLESHDG